MDFSILDKYVVKEKKEDLCSHIWKKEIEDTVCIECGIVNNNITNNTFEDTATYNTSTQYASYLPNTTFIKGQSSHNLRKLHIWANNNNSYNFRKRCYEDIIALLEKYDIDKRLYPSIRNNITSLYEDHKIRFRGNIKQCIFIYLIYFSAKELEMCRDIDIIHILETEGITISKYNIAVKKLVDALNTELDYLPCVLKDLRDNGYNQFDIIQRYNEFLETVKDNKHRTKKLNKLFIKHLKSHDFLKL